MRIRILAAAIASLAILAPVWAQKHIPTPSPQPKEDPAAVARGQAQFRSTCGFCHGEDATGSRAPDLVRSAILSHDVKGDLIGQVIHNGRPDKGMPSFPSLSETQIADIAAFLHHQRNAALHSAHVPGDYPLSKLLTGNAEEGKAYFDGPGGCSRCHSVTGDLKGIANKYSPIELQQEMTYPSHEAPDVTATVTLPNGERYEGKVLHRDNYNIAIICQDGWYRSWQIDQVKVEVHDPLEAHRELMEEYSDRDIHNLFAYLETLK